MEASLLSLPSELIQSIVILLPINSHLLDVGLASKLSLGALLLQSPSFARLHYNTRLNQRVGRIWDWLTSEGAKFDGWRLLPFHYKLHVYFTLMTAHEWQFENLVYSRSLNPWPLNVNSLKIMSALVDPNGAHLLDPSSENNRSIYVAASMGYSDVVSLLLHDPRVDPCVDNNLPLKMASEMGHELVVRVLMQDRRVNSATDNHSAATKAAENGHVGTLRVLVADRHVSADLFWARHALLRACDRGFFDVVSFLLDLVGDSPEWLEKWLEAALKSYSPGATAIVKLLLQKMPVLPKNLLQRAATSVPPWTVVNVACLLEDSRVDPARENGILITAATKGNLEMVMLLLGDGRANKWWKRPHDGLSLLTLSILLNERRVFDFFVKELEENHANIDCHTEALQDAIANVADVGNANMMRPLLSLTEKFGLIMSFDEHPMYSALKHGHYDTVSAILSFGKNSLDLFRLLCPHENIGDKVVARHLANLLVENDELLHELKKCLDGPEWSKWSDFVGTKLKVNLN